MYSNVLRPHSEITKRPETDYFVKSTDPSWERVVRSGTITIGANVMVRRRSTSSACANEDWSMHAVLNAIAEGQERERYRLFFASAAQAISALQELDLEGFELDEEQAMDLSLFEIVAQALRHSVDEVNDFLEFVIQRVRLLQEVDGETKAADDATGPEPLLVLIAESLRREVLELGAAMRNPAISGKHWNLLDRLQEFRGKCRAGIGEMVYAAAAHFAPVKKSLVVPYYVDDLQRAVRLRRAVAKLGMHVRDCQVALAGDRHANTVVLEALNQLLDELEQSWLYPCLRATDKRGFVRAHGLLKGMSEVQTATGKLDGQGLGQSIDSFKIFLESMTAINRREVLMVHDRDLFPRVRSCVGKIASYHRYGHDEGVRASARIALHLTERLYGRDGSIDRWLDSATSFAPEKVAANTLLNRYGELGKCIAQAQMLMPA